MKYSRWLCLVSLVCLVLIPVLCLSGCANEPTLFEYKIVRDDNTESYLRIMQVWHEKWDELYWRTSTEDPRFDELINELVSIDPPRSMKYEHEEYIVTHQLFITAKRHCYRLEQAELKEWLETGEIGYPTSWSREYGEARQIANLALQVLARVRAQYQFWYFWWLEEK